jgi:hypothetical protein
MRACRKKPPPERVDEMDAHIRHGALVSLLLRRGALEALGVELRSGGKSAFCERIHDAQILKFDSRRRGLYSNFRFEMKKNQYFCTP